MLVSSPCLAAAFALATSSALGACLETADPAAADIRLVRCADGTNFAADATTVRSSAALVTSHPGVIQLDEGAIAISSSLPLKVLTPDAVVSGDAGEWAVAVENGRTRAFVWSGAAALRFRAENSETPAQAIAGAAEGGLDRLGEALRRTVR